MALSMNCNLLSHRWRSGRLGTWSTATDASLTSGIFPVAGIVDADAVTVTNESPASTPGGRTTTGAPDAGGSCKLLPPLRNIISWPLSSRFKLVRLFFADIDVRNGHCPVDCATDSETCAMAAIARESTDEDSSGLSTECNCVLDVAWRQNWMNATILCAGHRRLRARNPLGALIDFLDY